LGIIKRQAYWGTILSYLGVGIGYITTAIIFPKFLTTSEIGLLAIFMSYGYIFGQLGTLGTGRITITVFPMLRERSKSHHGFFLLMMLVSAIGLIIALGIMFLIKPVLISNSHDQSPLLGEYFNFMYPVVIATFLFLQFDSMNTALLNAVRGIFLKEFFQRLLILFAVSFYALALVNFRQFTSLYVIALGLPAIILIYYILKNEDFKLKPSFDQLLWEKNRLMINIGINGVIIGFSGMIMLVIDRIMVERFMGLGPTGIYTTLAYFATLVSIPSRALLKISDPLIAQYWKEKNVPALQDNYHRSSLHQFLIGCLILIGLWGNITNILRILPPDYAIGKWVVLFIGFAFLADMLTGTATFILANSKYFKYQTLYIIFLAILIIIANLFMIPLWGLTGAAVATFAAKIISNLVRHQILYRKFGLQPYNAKFLLIILITGAAYLTQYFIPAMKNLYMDISVRSVIMSVVFIALTLGLKISPEINEKFLWALEKARKLFNGPRT
jgi:O-antigen/teichoic acid export membrane protein